MVTVRAFGTTFAPRTPNSTVLVPNVPPDLDRPVRLVDHQDNALLTVLPRRWAAPEEEQLSQGAGLAAAFGSRRINAAVLGAIAAPGIFAGIAQPALAQEAAVNNLPVGPSPVATASDVLFTQVGPAGWQASDQPTLRRGSDGLPVMRLQERLNTLGYSVGEVDGNFGQFTERAVRAYQADRRLGLDGVVGQETWSNLASAQLPKARAVAQPTGAYPVRAVYPPRAAVTIQLFEEAARRANLPPSWASSHGLHRILDRESEGVVGKLNYTYGNRSTERVHAELRRGVITARSSATGLGQLLLSNVERYYPSGRAGIGDPMEEAIGMLRYIKDRYGNPDRAWANYGRFHEGY